MYINVDYNEWRVMSFTLNRLTSQLVGSQYETIEWKEQSQSI